MVIKRGCRNSPDFGAFDLPLLLSLGVLEMGSRMDSGVKGAFWLRIPSWFGLKRKKVVLCILHSMEMRMEWIIGVFV